VVSRPYNLKLFLSLNLNYQEFSHVLSSFNDCFLADITENIKTVILYLLMIQNLIKKLPTKVLQFGLVVYFFNNIEIVCMIDILMFIDMYLGENVSTDYK